MSTLLSGNASADHRRRDPKMILPQWPMTARSAIDNEVRRVVTLFDERVASLPEHLKGILASSDLMSCRGTGFSHYLPFWLDDAFAGGRLREPARRMALGNRFGQVFCILRDAVVDGDDGATPALLLPLDALFFQFMREYQQLFAADHHFWTFFEHYWHEYLEALSRERWRSERCIPYDYEDLRWIARKYSPVKICAAGMTLLSGHLDLLPRIEELVEALQTGHQLLDDLADWRTDLECGRRSWPLHLVGALKPTAPPVAEIESRLWSDGVAAIVYGRAAACFRQCERSCGALGLRPLQELLAGFNAGMDETLRVVEARSRRSGNRRMPTTGGNTTSRRTDVGIFTVWEV